MFLIHLCYLPVPLCLRLNVIQRHFHILTTASLTFTSPILYLSFPFSLQVSLDSFSAFSLTCFPLTLTAAPHCSYPPLTLTSVLPHQLHTLGREHGKTKASHQKLLSESQNRETQLTQVAEARERLLMEQQSAAQAHHVQQTRMQATIAQQSKLIDYLQGTPRSRLKIKKVIIALFLVSFPDPQQDPPYRGSGNETTLFSASHTPSFLQAMNIGDVRG